MATHSLPLIATTAAPLYSEICSVAEKRGEGTTITRGQTLAPLRAYVRSERAKRDDESRYRDGLSSASTRGSDLPTWLPLRLSSPFLCLCTQIYTPNHRSSRERHANDETDDDDECALDPASPKHAAPSSRSTIGTATMTMRATSFPRAGPTYLFPEEGSLPSSLSLLVSRGSSAKEKLA